MILMTWKMTWIMKIGGKEVISNEERKVLEDTKVEIPELKIDDYLNSENCGKVG
jgi:hypothetical protein